MTAGLSEGAWWWEWANERSGNSRANAVCSGGNPDPEEYVPSGISLEQKNIK